MNKAVMTAAGLLIASHSLIALISRYGGDTSVTSFYPAPFDTLLATPSISDPAIEIRDIPVSKADISDTSSQAISPEQVVETREVYDTVTQESLPQVPDTAVSSHEITTLPGTDSTDAVTKGLTSPVREAQEPAPVAILDNTPLAPEPVPALSPEDSLLLLIPEKAWPDSHRIRYELTPEIASEYPNGKFVPRTVENTVWGVGEHLVFSIDYGFLNAGTATMSVLGIEEVNGDECYHIQTTARSNDFISSFYEVRDQVNSYIDKEGIFSRRIEKLLREGSYKSDRYVDFYPDRLIAIRNEKKKPVTEIPLYVQDVLSSLYLIRTYDLEVGTDVFIETYADGKVYPLRVKVHKTETIKVPAGKFTCYVVEPFLQSDGIFRQKGQLKVWLTKDEYKIPVKMTSKIVIGSIGTNLESYQLGATNDK